MRCRLQTCHAAAEHWVNWQASKETKNRGEKRVVWAKHHCWTDDYRIRECRPNRDFALAALANVK